jgi:hypothetical protein
MKEAMEYQKPTMLGLAYVCRLFREVETPMFQGDLQSSAKALALLKWLNNWGCRINTASLPALSKKLLAWSREWTSQLPRNVALVEFRGPHLDHFAAAYAALRTLGLGSTSASKTLFALRPKAAIAWDKPIREQFHLNADGSEAYRAMLVLSKEEAETVIADAARCGVTNWRDIPERVGSRGRTLPQLLDQYHWITVTRGHRVPTRAELERWSAWL